MVLYEDNKAKYDAVSKDLFRLVQRDEKIHDVEFKTKPIGFFMDVWLRFVKNKASVIAAVIILIISFFAVFGPGMNEYTYDEQHTELTNMPPKVPFIAKMNLGFFDGGYTMENRKYDNLNDPESTRRAVSWRSSTPDWSTGSGSWTWSWTIISIKGSATSSASGSEATTWAAISGPVCGEAPGYP